MNDDEEYVLGDDVTDLFLAPRDQRGIVISVRFDMDEAAALFQASEFHDKLATRYIKDLVMAEVYRPQTKWVSV